MALTHLTLAQRKAISPRIHFFEATHGGKGLLDFAHEGAAGDFGQLWNTLTTLSNRGFSDSPRSTNSPNTIPLDQFLQSLTADFSSSAQPLYNGKSKGLTLALVERVTERLNSISCSQCADKKAVCDGTDDDSIVANGGHCILPLKKMFALATEVTNRYYRYYSALFRRLQPPTIFLSTGHTRMAKTEYLVGGATFYHDGARGGRVSEVKLTVSVNEMDEESYLAIPYVLFHESVCHVLAYTALKDGKPRDYPEPEDPFTEGWMDFLCMEILSEFLSGEGPARDLLKEVAFPEGHSRHGREVHERKSQVTLKSLLQPQSQPAIGAALGKRAGIKVWHFLNSLLPSREEARRTFFELSFGLNLHSFSGKGLEFFVWQLDGLLSEPGVPPTPEEMEQAAEIFANYMKKKDIKSMYDAVVHMNIHLTSE